MPVLIRSLNSMYQEETPSSVKAKAQAKVLDAAENSNRKPVKRKTRKRKKIGQHYGNNCIISIKTEV